MSCSRKEQWCCSEEQVFDPPQAPFQPDMKKPPRRRAKGQYCAGATIISVIHTVLTVVSIGLRDPFSWERDAQEAIDLYLLPYHFPLCLEELCYGIQSVFNWISTSVQKD